MRENKFLYWFPRVLAIVYALFLSIFALDVFGTGYGFGQLMLALVMHLLPSILVIVALLIGWKNEQIGGYGFIVLGIVFTIWFSTYNSVLSFIFVSLPVLAVGGVFLWTYYKIRQMGAIQPWRGRVNGI